MNEPMQRFDCMVHEHDTPTPHPAPLEAALPPPLDAHSFPISGAPSKPSHADGTTARTAASEGQHSQLINEASSIMPSAAVESEVKSLPALDSSACSPFIAMQELPVGYPPEQAPQKPISITREPGALAKPAEASPTNVPECRVLTKNTDNTMESSKLATNHAEAQKSNVVNDDKPARANGSCSEPGKFVTDEDKEDGSTSLMLDVSAAQDTLANTVAQTDEAPAILKAAISAPQSEGVSQVPPPDPKPVKQRRERSLRPGGGKRAQPLTASLGFVLSSTESSRKRTYTSEELRRILSDMKKAGQIDRPGDLRELRILIEGPGGIMTPVSHVPRDSGPSYTRPSARSRPQDPVPLPVPAATAAVAGPWIRQAAQLTPQPQQTVQPNNPTTNPVIRGRGRPRQDALDCLSRDVHSILNKITPQTFDRLSDRLLRLTIENDAMLEKFVDIVFEKAVMEPNFANLYAELCIKMKEKTIRWPFVHILFDQDSNQYRWIRELGQDSKVAGPYATVRDCEGAALSGAPPPLKTLTDKLIPEKLLVVQGTFIKVFKSVEQVDHFYVCTQRFDSVPQSWYSDNAFTTEQEASSSALKQNTFHYRLLDKCQNEFFKTNPYEEADHAQAELEKRTDLPSNERLLEQAKIQELRGLLKFKMLGNIRFIGELYQVGLLKMQIIESCLQRLLGWSSTENRWSEEILDEHYLESMCKLYTTVGAKFESDADKKKKNFAYQDYFFQRLQALAQDRRLNARIRFGIQDLIDLQKNRWTPRREEAKPQTLEEIHRQISLQNVQAATVNPVPSPYTAQPSQTVNAVAHAKRRPSDPQIGRTAVTERTRDSVVPRAYQQSQQPSQPPQQSMPASARADERRRDIRAQQAAAAMAAPRTQLQQDPSPAGPPPHPGIPAGGVQNATAGQRKVLSPEVIKRRVDTLISEYLSMLDAQEAVECMDELPAQASTVFIQEIVRRLLECGLPDKRTRMYDLVGLMLLQNRLRAAEAQEGLQTSEQLILLLDSVLDNKSAPEVIGTLLGMLCSSSTGVCSLEDLKNLVRIIMARSVDDGVEDEVVVLVGRLIVATIRTWMTTPGMMIHDLRRNTVTLSDLAVSEADSIALVKELALYTVFQDTARLIITTVAELNSAVTNVMSKWGTEEATELRRLCNSWEHLNV